MSKQESTALARVPGRQVAVRVDEIAAGAMELFKGAGSFGAVLDMAQAIGDLKALLTPEVMQPIMNLQNSALGFLTDKQREGGYSLEVVREVFIEATLRGFRAVGNEYNIISGRFYGAKEGFRRKVVTWPGLRELRESYGLPEMTSSGAVVKCSASWELDGKPDHIDAEIGVRVNNQMGADAVIGKAQRKLYKRIHDRLSGIQTPDGEVGEDAPAAPVTTAPPKSVIIKGTRKEEMLGEDSPTVPRLASRFAVDMRDAPDIRDLGQVADAVSAAFKAGTVTQEERDTLRALYAERLKALKAATEGQEIT